LSPKEKGREREKTFIMFGLADGAVDNHTALVYVIAERES
jgi:hypothetical protein